MNIFVTNTFSIDITLICIRPKMRSGKKVDWIESNEAINTRSYISETNKPGAIWDRKYRRILDHSDTFRYSRKAYVLYFVTFLQMNVCLQTPQQSRLDPKRS